MSDDRDFQRATTDWLEAGSDRTPPKAVDAVLLAVRTTRQDRVLPNPWRQFDMNALAKALVAATAVVAIALAWFNLGPSGNGVGVIPAPTPTPSPTPTHPTPVLRGRRTARAAGAATPSRAERPIPPSRSSCHPAGPEARTFRRRTTETPAPRHRSCLHGRLTMGSRTRAPTTRPSLPAAGSGPAGLLAVIAGQPGIDAGTDHGRDRGRSRREVRRVHRHRRSRNVRERGQ